MFLHHPLGLREVRLMQQLEVTPDPLAIGIGRKAVRFPSSLHNQNVLSRGIRPVVLGSRAVRAHK